MDHAESAGECVRSENLFTAPTRLIIWKYISPLIRRLHFQPRCAIHYRCRVAAEMPPQHYCVASQPPHATQGFQ